MKVTASISISRAIDNAAAGNPAELPAAVQAALSDMALFWDTRQLPRHFEGDAARRYGPGATDGDGNRLAAVYAARTARYQKQKLARVGHNNPMVYTGRMRADLLRPPTLELTKTRVAAAVKLRTGSDARALRLWGPGRKHDFDASMRAMTRAEVAELAKLFELAGAAALKRELEAAPMRPSTA